MKMKMKKLMKKLVMMGIVFYMHRSGLYQVVKNILWLHNSKQTKGTAVDNNVWFRSLVECIINNFDAAVVSNDVMCNRYVVIAVDNDEKLYL